MDSHHISTGGNGAASNSNGGRISSKIVGKGGIFASETNRDSVAGLLKILNGGNSSMTLVDCAQEALEKAVRLCATAGEREVGNHWIIHTYSPALLCIMSEISPIQYLWCLGHTFRVFAAFPSRLHGWGDGSQGEGELFDMSLPCCYIMNALLVNTYAFLSVQMRALAFGEVCLQDSRGNSSDVVTLIAQLKK